MIILNNNNKICKDLQTAKIGELIILKLGETERTAEIYKIGPKNGNLEIEHKTFDKFTGEPKNRMDRGYTIRLFGPDETPETLEQLNEQKRQEKENRKKEFEDKKNNRIQNYLRTYYDNFKNFQTLTLGNITFESISNLPDPYNEGKFIDIIWNSKIKERWNYPSEKPEFYYQLDIQIINYEQQISSTSIEGTEIESAIAEYMTRFD